MPYITCTHKKSHHKIDVAKCHKCKGIKCYDYRDYVQPALFPGITKKPTIRKTVKPKRIKTETIPLPNSPEQLSFEM
jgi:hypothetical protein